MLETIFFEMLLITPLLYLEIKQLTTFAQFPQAV